MASITSVELNYLVFRYLQESGFTHSAFVFGNEGGINKCPIDGNLVPPGALVTFVQKGLQFLEMEANLNNCDADFDEDFSFLQPLDLITKDVHELKKMVNERRRKRQRGKTKESEKEHDGDRGLTREKERQEREKEREKDKENLENHKEQELQNENQISREMVSDQEDKINGTKKEDAKKKDRVNGTKKDDGKKEGKVNGAKKEDKVNVKLEEDGAFGGPEPMDICTTSAFQPCEFLKSDVTILEGHKSEVCACAWSPTGSFLASGSGDSTARIWTIAEGTRKLDSKNDPSSVLVLQHIRGTTTEKNKDVTTLDWNGEGTLLATGSYDGQARIWTTNGELKSTLCKHKGPIFSLKWNKKGDYILTGGFDGSAIVWDVQAEKWKQQFDFHRGSTLDVDWRNNVSFASSSNDTMIHVCKIGENHPVKTFAGHQGEVNCIKWDPTGSILASCSDDNTAKIWSMKQDKYIHDFREHSKEIYAIRWSPTGPGTNNPNKKLVLASASCDSTVKLWDAELGKLIHSLNGHRDRVYTISFSPNGEYLASGSPDKSINIWSLNDGKIIKTYKGNGGIFEVCWNKEGDKIAACFSNNTVCILDFRM
ncbi:putative transcription factor WD40-like family [Medicago truncatula]|uniref:Putative transcription factor WD40-like family n=1 Tax=Medicago truncatula TaxID=3880 RepID=G7K578_MEDTR|nr:WD40 repeat-containing protein HOS15 isoform X2 [Medicago truncatula]AES94615.2 transducin family protein/WD-40 repeat protein [Medicago truncatula]RHN53972.1 putative transcription factor WD40-like family [Medicago truncatula]